MATKILKSLKGRRMRLTRLDECGAVVASACSSIVTSGFITVNYQFEVESGDEYTQKNADGALCISEKDPDRNKWVNVSLEMCEIHPDVLDMLANGTPISDGVDVIGASFDASENTSAFAIEVWTKQAGVCTGGTPSYGYFVAPFVKNGRVDGGFEITNGVMTLSLAGNGAADDAGNWTTGPYGDNPLLAAAGLPVGAMMAAVLTTVAPPAESDGCAAIV